MGRNAEIVKAAMDALFKDKDEAALRKLLTSSYVQHNPGVPTGLDAVISLLPTLKEMQLGYTLHRIIEDGPLVLTHTTYSNAQIFAAENVVAFDIWRVEGGLVAEHWDAIIPLKEKNPSGRLQTGGPTDIVDDERTEENKALAQGFVTECLIGEDFTNAGKYVKNYLQHNPMVADGLTALQGAVTAIKNDKIHRVIGQGNFALTQSQGRWADGDVPLAIYDLFRIENGAIVENWDVLQDIPSTMAHDNTMF